MITAHSAAGLAEAWLYSVLSTDAGLLALGVSGVYDLPAPEGSVYPFIGFANLSGKDTTALGFIRTLSTQTYAVHAVAAANSKAVIDQIAARIDAVLQGGAATAPQGYILGCVRQMQTSLSGVTAGVIYREFVQTYQIVVREGSTA